MGSTVTLGERQIGRIVTAFAVAVLALTVGATAAHAAYNPADPAQKARHDAAQAVGTLAYQYGLPLLDMQRTFDTSTSTNVASGRGGGPVNRFSHFRKLADAKDRTVVVPNADTLYSMAWLDLRKQPQIVHSAKGTTRFHVFELLTPYTENFVNIGSPRTARPDGDYLLTGPGWHGHVPKGLKRIRSPYDRVWIIGRTYIAGAADLAATRRVQNTYRITPLNRWHRDDPYGYTPRRPKHVDDTVDQAHMPGTVRGEDPVTWLDALGDQLKRFPPPAADGPTLAKLAALDIGAGRHPLTDGKLTAAQLQGLRDAVAGGSASVRAELLRRYFAGFDQHNGWLVGRVGTYGTDYALRALADQFGLGAPRPEVSVYPLTFLDRNRQALTGATRYVAHFDAATAHPPVKFFWSLTLYDNDGFLVDNPLGRYLVNDRSKLRYNADGSLDVYVQPTAPSTAAQRANWLPSPSANAATPGFRLMVRLYGLSAAGISGVVDGSGWHAPTILPCLPSGRTATGVACAS
jgi:hypothetical protein